MAQQQTQTIARDQFLTMAANLLYRAFLDTTRTESKKVFRELERGSRVVLTDVQMEDKSTVRFELELDQTELDGRLNYGAFRSSVGTLIHNLGEALKQDEPQIPVFTAQQNADVHIFGVTAVTREGEEARVMVLGSDTASGPSVLLRLMYLDPAQFMAPAEEAAAQQTA